MTLPPSGFINNEYYLYADKQWETIPSGVMSYSLASGVMQNAPVVVTSSGWEGTSPEDPWAIMAGPGKWTPRGYGFFTLTPEGDYDTTVKEFSLNPGAAGKIEFNRVTPDILYVEYEAGPSGYYTVDSINVNPIMRETDSGFLQIANVGSPAYLSLKATQSVFKGDGYHLSNLMATLYDRDLNRISGEDIVFEMLFNLEGYSGPYEDTGYLTPGKLDGQVFKVHPDGFVCETMSTTDKFGQATASCRTLGSKDGWMAFKAYYYNASGIYDTAEVTAYNWRKGLSIL